jgi:tetratricopeptide (TPR) repeat protein
VGLWDDKVSQLEARAAHMLDQGLPLEAAAVLNDAGLTALEGGMTDRARPLFEQVAAVFRAGGRTTDASAALANLALLAMRVGSLDEAAERFQQALDLLPCGDRLGDDVAAAEDDRRTPGLQEADTRVNFGVLLRRRGDLAGAAEQYERALTLYTRHHRHLDVLDVEGNLAVLDERAGRLSQARQRLTRIREQLPPGVDDRARARAATTLAAVAAQQGSFGEARCLLDEAQRTYQALELPRELADVRTNQGYVHLHTGDLVSARRCLESAQAAYAWMGLRLEQARVLGGLGSLELRSGNVHAAVEHFAVAMESYEERGLDRELAATLVNLGVAHAADGDWTSAEEFQRAALEIYTDIDERGGQGQHGDAAAQARHNLGVALAGQGDHRGAGRQYARARAGYLRLGRSREAAELDMNLGIVAAARGDLATARRRYRRAAKDLRAVGLWPQLARCLHNLGLTWAPAAPGRRVRVLPAWLALESLRYALPRAADRARWRDAVGDPEAAAFDAAHRHGPLLLAEVIERARAVGSLGTSDEPPPAPIPGLVGGPGLPAESTWDLPVRTPRPVGCGWPATLTPHLDRARTVLDAGDARSALEGPTDPAPLVGLLLASSAPTEVG